MTGGHPITRWTRFWPFLTPSPLTWTILLNKTCEVTDIWAPPSTPLLVHVVIEWPLMVFDIRTNIISSWYSVWYVHLKQLTNICQIIQNFNRHITKIDDRSYQNSYITANPYNLWYVYQNIAKFSTLNLKQTSQG